MLNKQNINAIIIIIRLINMSTLQLEGSKGHLHPQYATLSHKWQAPVEEVFYDDFHAGRKRLAGGWLDQELLPHDVATSSAVLLDRNLLH